MLLLLALLLLLLLIFILVVALLVFVAHLEAILLRQLASAFDQIGQGTSCIDNPLRIKKSNNQQSDHKQSKILNKMCTYILAKDVLRRIHAN